MTYQEFISKHKLGMTCERINERKDQSEWGSATRHWSLRIFTPGIMDFTSEFTDFRVEFSQGSAHTKEPQLDEVLDCLASDAAGVENANNFEDWCAEYGFDEDSRKAEKIYLAALDQAEALKNFLGSDAYNELLWDMERL
jgi:hypothetical protein